MSSFPVVSQISCSYPQGKSQSKWAAEAYGANSIFLATFMFWCKFSVVFGVVVVVVVVVVVISCH